MFESLYVSRPLLNAAEVARHFARQGLRSLLAPEDMHVTVCYSKQTLWWRRAGEAPEKISIPPGARSVELLGDQGALVMRFEAAELQARHQVLRAAGASHDFPSYLPHVTITYDGAGFDPESLVPFPGPLLFGPERFKPVKSDWKPKEEIAVNDVLDKAVVMRVPMIAKARPMTADGRRIIEVAASSETVDFDGDLVLQKALIDSAPGFLASGHLDLDHKSEFGMWMGIADPASYIVGRPLDVNVLPGGHTAVIGEISKSRDGSVNPAVNRYDELWLSLQAVPEVKWYSSIYGFPTDIDDCSDGSCTVPGVTRFVIKALDWRSLALTRTPKNEGLIGAARIVTAKAYMVELAKSMLPTVSPMMTMDGVWKARNCDACDVQTAPSLMGYRQHFAKCCCLPPDQADLAAHAVMHKHILGRQYAR